MLAVLLLVLLAVAIVLITNSVRRSKEIESTSSPLTADEYEKKLRILTLAAEEEIRQQRAAAETGVAQVFVSVTSSPAAGQLELVDGGNDSVWREKMKRRDEVMASPEKLRLGFYTNRNFNQPFEATIEAGVVKIIGSKATYETRRDGMLYVALPRGDAKTTPFDGLWFQISIRSSGEAILFGRPERELGDWIKKTRQSG